jgi:hypothetical protein
MTIRCMVAGLCECDISMTTSGDVRGLTERMGAEDQEVAGEVRSLRAQVIALARKHPYNATRDPLPSKAPLWPRPRIR